MNDSVIVVFDLGGTNVRVAAASGETIETPIKVRTPQNPHEGIDVLAECAHQVAGGRTIRAIAGGMPGVIKENTLLWAANLPEWKGINVGRRLSEALNAPIHIEHDTATIALGEYYQGAGKGSHICAYVTVSTGVGGDRVIEGVLDHATYGFEIGHQMVGSDTLEHQVSGTAVRKKYGVEPKDLADINARNELADTLALGLYNTTLHWGPDRFVLGGSMITGVNPIPLDRVAESLAKHLVMYPTAPEIKMATLGDMGGLHGARILASKMSV